MIIPWQELSEEALNNVIREYILSQLEDYQMEATAMEQWQSQVMNRLKSGEAVVEWSESNETVSIVDAKKYSGTNE